MFEKQINQLQQALKVCRLWDELRLAIQDVITTLRAVDLHHVAHCKTVAARLVDVNGACRLHPAMSYEQARGEVAAALLQERVAGQLVAQAEILRLQGELQAANEQNREATIEIATLAEELRGERRLTASYRKGAEESALRWAQIDQHSAEIAALKDQLSAALRPPLSVGAKVRTLRDTLPGGYSAESRVHCQWGVVGSITHVSGSHGVCYQVRHEDDTQAWYEPSELEVVPHA